MRVLFAVLVGASAAGCEAAADRPAPRTPPPTPAPAVESLEERLKAGDRPAPLPSGRNPFRFETGAARRPRGERALPAAEGLPELPLPIAAPPLRLLGVATRSDGSRVAVMMVGGDLVLARQGDQLAGRYTVSSIGDESVELTDAVGERPMRLDLP